MIKLRDFLHIEKNNYINIEDNERYVIAGVQSYGKGIVNRRTVYGYELTMRKYQVIQPNQLMWCKVDTKNGAFGVTKAEHEGALASSNMVLASIDLKKIDPRFLETIFSFRPFYEYINSISTGTTNRKYLKPTEVLEKIEVPEMTLREQQSWLEQYFVFREQFDDYINSINETRYYLGRLRQQILQNAVSGTLVEQDPTDEPASKLLQNILDEKDRMVKGKIIKKEKSLPLIASDDIPYELPQNWKWVRLGELAESVDYGTSVKSNSQSHGVPILRMNNIQDGKVVLDELKYVPTDIPDLPRLYLADGDILFNRTNSYELVGKSGVYHGESENYTFASYLIRIRLLRGHVMPAYVNAFLNSPICRAEMEPNITQQNGQANFNGSKVKNLIVPLPPLVEQYRIMDKVNRLFDLFQQLLTNLIQVEELHDLYEQSTLKKLF